MSDSAIIVLVVLVWAAMIWGGIALIHHLSDRQGPLDNAHLVGVRGWLTVLVGGLLIWGPLIGITRFYQDLSKAESLNPGLENVPIWDSYTTLMWIIVLSLTAWQAHVGWKLCRNRDPSVVEYLRKYLIWSPIAALTLGLPNVILLDGDYPFSEMVGGLLGQAVVNSIWFWYVAKSKRVSATYGLREETQNFTLPHHRSATPKTERAVSTSIPASFESSDATERDHWRRTQSFMSKKQASPSSSDDSEALSLLRLEKIRGISCDEALYSKCLINCDFDHLRATAMYQRVKSEPQTEISRGET